MENANAAPSAPAATPAATDHLPATGMPHGAPARSPLFWKLMLVAMALMWGFSFFVMKDVLDALPPYLLLGVRFLPAALLMLAIYRRRILANLDRAHIAVGLAMGIFMGVAYVFQTLGLGETTPGKNAFLTGTYCVLVPFISYVMAREPLTRYNVGAAVICLAGIGLVALDNLSMNIGDALTLAGAFFFALEIAVVAKYGRDIDVNVMTFWMFLLIGVGSLATSAVTEVPPAPSTWTPGLVGTLVFLSGGCTCLALLVQNLALAHVPSSTGSLLLSLESPSGVFFSVVMTGEVLTGRLVAGFALIFFAVVLSETHLSFLRRR